MVELFERLDFWIVVIALVFFIIPRFLRNPIGFIVEWFVNPIMGRSTAPRSTPKPAPAQAAPRSTPAPVVVPDYGAFVKTQQAGPQMDWLREINDKRDEVPHIAIIGPSGSGKSTLMLAALSQSSGMIVITTPKSAADDPWGGFPAVRSGVKPDTYEPTYEPIGHAWQAVYHEMNLRNADPQRPRYEIKLIIDELATSIDELRHIDPHRILLRIWRMGRSVGIRLYIMDQGMNVKAWGIDGQGAIRESIVFIRTERDKSAHFFEWDAARNVAINRRPFDTADVPALAARGLDPARLWLPNAPAPAALAAPAAQAAPLYNPPTSAAATAHEASEIRRWQRDGAGKREMARRLYAARGGDDAEYDGDGGAFKAVKAVVDEEGN